MPQDEKRMDGDSSADPGWQVTVQPTLTQLVEAHGGYVEAVVRRLGVPASDAADVSQEVWVVIVRRVHSFEGRSAMRTWLYGICRRVCHDYFRRAHRHHEQTMDRLPEPYVEALQHRQLEANERLAVTIRASAELSADRIDVLDAVASGSAGIGTLAKRHRCADKTIFSRLYAAREQLRRALRRAGYAVGLPLEWPGAAIRGALRRWSTALSGAAVTTACAAAMLMPASPGALSIATGVDAPGAPRLIPYTRLAVTVRSPEPVPPRAAVAESTRAVADLEAAPTVVEFTVFDVVEPASEMHLRQVAFMEFVPFY